MRGRVWNRGLRDALARGEAVGPQLRILAVDELVRRVRVREDELRAGEGRVAVVQRAAVEVEEVPGRPDAAAFNAEVRDRPDLARGQILLTKGQSP